MESLIETMMGKLYSVVRRLCYIIQHAIRNTSYEIVYGNLSYKINDNTTYILSVGKINKK